MVKTLVDNAVVILYPPNMYPYRLKWDAYEAIADNDEIAIPALSGMIEIWINVITAQAGQTIRIGTTDGGQEIVADSNAPQTQGLQQLTVLIPKSVAADTFYIGSDGGSGWTTLDADIYVRYQTITGLTANA